MNDEMEGEFIISSKNGLVRKAMYKKGERIGWIENKCS